MSQYTRTAESYERELRCARLVLRDMCETYGLDNSWPENLWLADIIEKRLWRGIDAWMKNEGVIQE